MARRKPVALAAPAHSAVIIPFPHYRRRNNIPAAPGFATPDFEAGFECAMSMVAELKRRGLLRGIGR